MRLFEGNDWPVPRICVIEIQSRFRAGEQHEHYEQWENLAGDQPSPPAIANIRMDREQDIIFQFFHPFSGNFKGQFYDSARPPSRKFRNNPSCRLFADFVRRTLLDRLRMGAISLRGKVGEAKSPFLVLPLTVDLQSRGSAMTPVILIYGW